MSDNIETTDYQRSPAGAQVSGISRTSQDPSHTKMYYGGFWRRVLATIIDLYLGLAVLYLFYLALLTAKEASISVPYFLLVYLVTLWLYFTIMESSPVRATIGKLIMGIFVIDKKNRKVCFARANGRFWSKLISSLTLCIGFVMAGFTKKKQALHDIIAGTMVLRKKGELDISEKDQKTAKMIRSKSMPAPLLMIAGVIVPFMLPVVGGLVDTLFKIAGDSSFRTRTI